jgi:hypothetical protein
VQVIFDGFDLFERVLRIAAVGCSQKIGEELELRCGRRSAVYIAGLLAMRLDLAETDLFEALID